MLSPEADTTIRQIDEKTSAKLDAVKELKRRVRAGIASEDELQCHSRIEKRRLEKKKARAEFNNSNGVLQTDPDPTT